MNEIEAISVLETRIKYPNIDTYGGMCEAEYQQEAVVLAIEALREQAERDKGCEHCNPNPYGHGEAIKPLISQVFNDKAQISTTISGNGLHTLAIPSPNDTSLAKRYSKCQIIHFCPMCGKRLEEHHDAD